MVAAHDSRTSLVRTMTTSRRHFSWLTTVLLLLSLSLQQGVLGEISVTVPSKEDNDNGSPKLIQHNFESMPAMFGKPWRSGIRYHAKVRFLTTHPFLCDAEDLSGKKERRLEDDWNSTMPPYDLAMPPSFTDANEEEKNEEVEEGLSLPRGIDDDLSSEYLQSCTFT